ncbi:plasmid replication protein RepC [Rhodobaculum claviforme]|uniref:Replication initiation protein RepC n=1 Tax=Rhodobaculum claviforme TaxID=1549854 RepID=A0A934WH02_9RHOB|nr:plasmid replication protein RepC [Rhodobaculum claviforme]MBK5925904.1 hypothetical protein [Rhodobaculum claviforme]
MYHISLTPFGRQPVTAAHLAAAARAEAPAPVARICKWALLRDLTAARADYGLRDRDLAVLSALLSFHPEGDLEDGAALVVHPSNTRLSERAHGMAESTLRRHLAALVSAGMIVRRDSPNGKRYAARGPEGRVAFGFDLRPLLVQAPEIASRAAAARDAALCLRRLREATVIALRDTAKLLAWAADGGAPCPALTERHADLARGLRRKMDLTALGALHRAALSLRDEVKPLVIHEKTEVPGGSPRRIERHVQSSDKDLRESETPPKESATPPLPLELVLKAAPEILHHAPHGIARWRDLLAVAQRLHPMMDISADAWAEACRLMGPEAAAVTLACMLQRSTRIARPGGYLRRLSAKAAHGRFSPLPMVMALLRAEGLRAA